MGGCYWFAKSLNQCATGIEAVSLMNDKSQRNAVVGSPRRIAPLRIGWPEVGDCLQPPGGSSATMISTSQAYVPKRNEKQTDATRVSPTGPGCGRTRISIGRTKSQGRSIRR